MALAAVLQSGEPATDQLNGLLVRTFVAEHSDPDRSAEVLGVEVSCRDLVHGVFPSSSLDEP